MTEPASGSIASIAVPTQPSKTPNGCVIGLAEEIAQAIADCKYGPVKNQLAMRLWKSFKHAGYQKGSDAGLRYFFDLHALCADLDTTPRSLANMRRQLEADGLFTYTPNHEDYATGWCVWNPDYAHWKPLLESRPRRGGKRAGAGNPNWKQASGHQLNVASQRTPVERETTELTLVENTLKNEAFSEGVLSRGVASISECPPASSETASVQSSIDEPKKRVTEEIGTEETEANASLAPGARVVQETLLHSGQTAPRLPAVQVRKPASPPSHSRSGINAPARARLHEASTKETRAPNPLIDEQKRLLEDLKEKAWEANGRLGSPTGDKHLLRNLNDDAWAAVEDARRKLAELEAEAEQEEPEQADEPQQIISDAEQAALVVVPEAALVILPDPETWRRQLFSRLCEVFSISLTQMSKKTRDMLNGNVKQLKETGILPDQVPELKQVYHRTFREALCTPPALAKQAYLLKPYLA